MLGWPYWPFPFSWLLFLITIILIILVREQPWQMQFEFWGMQWFPKEKGELPPKDRSPGVHSQQNLEYTPSLVTPAPHTIYPTKDWEAEPGAFAEVFGIPLTKCLPPALRSPGTEGYT